MFLKYSLSILLIACTLASAEEPASNEQAAKKIKEPIFLFELPNRGALAVLLDKGAIKAGTSGSIKSAKLTIEQATHAKGSILFSCGDSHTTLAIEKSLPSFNDDSLSDLTFIISEQEKCSESLVQAIARTGASL